jgi:hypothetical protein
MRTLNIAPAGIGLLATAVAAAAADPPAKPDAAKAVRAVLASRLSPDSLESVLLEIRVPHSDGRVESYPIGLTGEEAVASAVRLLAAAEPVAPTEAKPAPAKEPATPPAAEVVLVFRRLGDSVELEKRGDVLLDLVAEDTPVPPGAVAVPARVPPVGEAVALAVEGPRFALTVPDRPPFAGLTLESADLRALLKSAVDADVKKAAEVWGDSLPYGLARSSLGEGIAYSRLGLPDEAAACWKRCVDTCRRHGKWPHLEKDAAERLRGLKDASAKPAENAKENRP